MGDFARYNTFQEPAEDQQQAAPTTIANEGGTQRITINGGDARFTSSGVQTFNTSEGFSAYPEDDWRSTARTSFGSPTNEITSDSTVTIGGITSTVEVFARAGVLQKQGDGYVLANAQQQAPQQQQQAQEDEAQGDDAATFPNGLDDAMNAAAEPFSQPTYDNGVALGMAAAMGEGDLDSVVAGVAKNSGMEPGDVQERAGFIVNAFQAQADNFITGRLGVSEGDLDDFYEFARQPENKGALRAALNGQLYGGSMAAWRPLVDRYMSNVAPNATALKARGFETKTSGNGEELVRIQGAWMTTKAAAKAGII